MAQRFVTTKTAFLYEGSTGSQRRTVLIFGDEVATSGPAQHGRVRAATRGVDGWIQADHLGEQRPLEMYFIDVGQGDSTFIVTPGGKTILIDGGADRRALGFLSWKYRLDDPGNRVSVDLLVLSHADSDHLNGLTPIVAHPQIDVRRIVHSGIATFADNAMATKLGDTTHIGGDTYLVTRHSSLAELPERTLSEEFSAWRDAIAAKECGYRAVDSESGCIDLGDPSVTLEVLGPRLSAPPGVPHRCYPYFGSESPTINGHSVVLKLTYGDVSALFPGDINGKGASHLLKDEDLRVRLAAHVLKAPHHGSHDFVPDFLRAVRPQITVISSGGEPDYGHPRASFVGAIGRNSRCDDALVFSTAIARNFTEVSERPPADEAVPAGADPKTIHPHDTRLHRLLFKRRLHGMINIRSDGTQLYAARRVAASYCWEAYGPLVAAT